jgi:hypothetical protein
MSGLGVAVFNHNRVHYNKLVIESLLSNPEHKVLPFHFFIDGDPSKDSGVAEVVKLIDNAPFPFKHMYFRGKQTGPNYTIVDGTQRMFEIHDYDKVIMIEDDNLQVSNSLKISINLSDYFDQFNNIGLTFSNSICYFPLEEKKQRLNEVVVSEGLPANCTLYKRAWSSIRDIMINYKNYVSKGVEFNGIETAEYLNDVVKHKEDIVGNIFPVDRRSHYLESAPNVSHVNHDCVLKIALAVKGYSALSTTVNFMKIIGEVGLNFDETLFKTLGLDKTVLDEIPEFSDVKEFVLVPS